MWFVEESEMTREDIIQAIAGDIDIIDGMSTTNAAISALATIEGLGFVIVPRVPDSDMYLRAEMHMGEEVKRNPGARLGDRFKAQWDGAIAASPLYRDDVTGN
jgi:hypothetical protein